MRRLTCAARTWIGLMKRNVLYAIGVALVPAFLSAGQAPWELRGPTIAEIVRVLGDEIAAGGMVARTITARLGSKTPMTVFVQAEQIRPEWLPLVAGVAYVVLDREQARAHIQSCGELLYVQSVTRNGPDATVSVGQGNRCRGTGITKSFRVDSSGWDVVENIAGGFGGASSHCECR